jgi:hypothetical protein
MELIIELSDIDTINQNKEKIIEVFTEFTKYINEPEQKSTGGKKTITKRRRRTRSKKSTTKRHRHCSRSKPLFSRHRRR